MNSHLPYNAFRSYLFFTEALWKTSVNKRCRYNTLWAYPLITEISLELECCGAYWRGRSCNSYRSDFQGNCTKAMLSGRTLHCGWILLVDWALDGDKAPPPEYTASDG
ncbi:MAG: hypothetical protein SPF63_00985 [Candidatus Cryptobacteroides sp.]|nr:hypothetical protein [Candidatus Cryptobacteroides sp.]